MMAWCKTKIFAPRGRQRKQAEAHDHVADLAHAVEREDPPDLPVGHRAEHADGRG